MPDYPAALAEGLKGMSGLLSPVRMVYVAYVVLAAMQILPKPSVAEFVAASALFLIFQIFHDDYFRIVLNGWGEAAKLRIIRSAASKP